MAFLVEQVDSDGSVIIDYDTSISVSKIYERLKKYFPGVYKNSSGMICGKYGDNKYSVRIKNVTYLGNPHPVYKKRIQISDDLQDFYKNSINMGMKPLLLGIYTYKENTLFCDFDIEDFISKKAHNSSAHVYTSDLAAATVDSYFQKIDYFGNHITVFNAKGVNVFFSELFDNEKETEYGQKGKDNFDEAYTVKTSNKMQEIELMKTAPYSKNILHYAQSLLPEKVVNHIGNFFFNEDRVWNGIQCYKKMIEANYKNKYQAEWSGFYLEFEFGKYLEQNNLGTEIKYAQDKKDGGIDLDLFFSEVNAYGDLKAHSESSRGIQGNDLQTIKNILYSGESSSHIYYVICEHGTTKDSECGFEVTEFWNRAQKKENLMSYSNKMKNSITLKKVYILDINQENEKYLSIFKQGVNSNGKPREPKIMIEHDNMKYFSIFELEL